MSKDKTESKRSKIERLEILVLEQDRKINILRNDIGTITNFLGMPDAKKVTPIKRNRDIPGVQGGELLMADPAPVMYTCKILGCGATLTVTGSASFLDIMNGAGWAVRRHVTPTPPDCWCPLHHHLRPPVDAEPSFSGQRLVGLPSPDPDEVALTKADIDTEIAQVIPDKILYDLLSLVSAELPAGVWEKLTIDSVGDWFNAEKALVLDWARAVHLSASDNIIDVPAMPEVLRHLNKAVPPPPPARPDEHLIGQMEKPKATEKPAVSERVAELREAARAGTVPCKVGPLAYHDDGPCECEQ